MYLERIIFGIASVSILLGSAPAFANNEVNMNNEQTTVITGSGNNVTNRSSQSVDINRDGKSKDGVSVRSKQTCDIVGNDNTCRNESEQKVEIHRRRR
jgi:hypothetical protein